MSDKCKNVQIPVETFIELYMLLNGLCESEVPEIRNRRLEAIREALNNKMNSLVERQLYTKSKIAPNAIEREQAIKEYIARKNIF